MVHYFLARLDRRLLPLALLQEYASRMRIQPRRFTSFQCSKHEQFLFLGGGGEYILTGKNKTYFRNLYNKSVLYADVYCTIYIVEGLTAELVYFRKSFAGFKRSLEGPRDAKIHLQNYFRDLLVVIGK